MAHLFAENSDAETAIFNMIQHPGLQANALYGIAVELFAITFPGSAVNVIENHPRELFSSEGSCIGTGVNLRHMSNC